MCLLLFSYSVISDSLWPDGLWHARLPCPSLSLRVCSYSCPLSQWFHPSRPPSSPSSPAFNLPSIRVFSYESALQSGSQSTGASALASVLTMNIQDWSPLRWTGWISLRTKGVSRVFSKTSSKASILQHSAFFIVQLSNPWAKGFHLKDSSSHHVTVTVILQTFPYF